MKAVTDLPEQADSAFTGRGRWISLFLGLALSAVLGYLAVKPVRWADVSLAMGRAEYRFLALAALGSAATLWLRAWRWRVILRPITHVNTWSLFAITSVGFLAIIAIPFRVGELVRPYLLRERAGVSFSTGLATIAVERCLDGLAFAGLIALAIPWLPLPAWAAKTGYLLSGGYLAGLAFLAWLWLVRDRLGRGLGGLVRRLAPARASVVEQAVKGFVAGLALLPDLAGSVKAALLSALIWVLGTTVNYVSFMALSLDLPWSAAAALQILVTLGVLLPTAPGFVGSFQFFTVMALALFGVGEAIALTYAILIHATVLVVHVVLGIACGLVLQIGWGFRWWKHLSSAATVPPVPHTSKERMNRV